MTEQITITKTTDVRSPKGYRVLHINGGSETLIVDDRDLIKARFSGNAQKQLNLALLQSGFEENDDATLDTYVSAYWQAAGKAA